MRCSQKCDFAWSKVKVIGQNKWHHRIPWPQKHRSRHQNCHPKCFSSKVMVKNIFLDNGGQRNTFVYVIRSYCSRYFLMFWKGPTQCYLVLKFSNILPFNNWDMAEMWFRKFPWTFIWHKLGLNTLSHYRDRAAETLPKINPNCYTKTRR